MKDIIKKLYNLTSPCRLCPQNCNIDRSKGEIGKCKTGLKPFVSSVNLHFGEESVLVGKTGSGTVFFAGCNLKCLFCQNYDISWEMRGREISVSELASQFLFLQGLKANNINLVTPTHQTAQIVEAIYLAKQNGLKIPIVYNCGGYESFETLKLLDGIIDIYMPDVKYFDNNSSLIYSNAKNYTEIVKQALKEMYTQVGDLEINSKGIAIKGLLIRHLVMPGGLKSIAKSKEILDFIKNEISENTYVNIMSQYRPVYRAREYPDTIGKRLLYEDYNEVKEYALKIGLRRGILE